MVISLGAGTAIAGVASAVGGLVSGLFGKKHSGSNSVGNFSNTAGGQLLSILSNGIKNKNLNFGSLVNSLGDLVKDKGFYANSALTYWLEDQSWQKQIDYNMKAMEKEYQYQLSSMAKQYKYDVAMQKRSYEMSQSLQNEQNEWSKMMSDTSHQREIADLRAAGLNPILSANGGANAYTSGSAIINGQTPTPSNPSALPAQRPNYTKAVDALIESQRVRNDTKVANAQAEKILREAENLDWTPEGIKRQLYNLGLGFGSDMVEGQDYTKDVTGVIKNLTNSNSNNAFSSLLSHIKGSKSLGKVMDYVGKLWNASNDSSRKFDYSALKNGLNNLVNKNSDYNIIHTKYGDLYDIDKYIRNKFNVSKKVQAHR